MEISDQTLRMALWIVYRLAVLSFAALSSSQNALLSVKDGDPLVLQILLREQKSMIIGVKKVSVYAIRRQRKEVRVQTIIV
jgi:hypothetical protein